MIGTKRNALCTAARGEIIAHFDDDDFYAPYYIERMVSLMTDLNVDFVKLFSFFLYHRKSNTLAYLDLERDFPLCFLLHAQEANVPVVAGRRGDLATPWGYGFSYVYSRRVWQEFNFPDQNHGEDQVFADKVVAKYRSAGKQDFARSSLHVLHDTNISWAYPQQIMSAKDHLAQFFPDFHP